MAAVIPELAVRRGREAIAFYAAAFGAVEAYRVGGTDEHEAVVAQLQIGESVFWVHDEAPEHGTFSPETLGGGTVRLLLIVDDPDAVMTSAIEAGATELRATSEEHGWRLGALTDPFGHQWEIGKPLRPWPPPAGGRSAA